MLTLVFTVLLAASLYAQPGIPFHGCHLEAISGSYPPPESPARPIPSNLRFSSELTWFETDGSLRLPGPRGWHCFAVSGSGGSYLFLSPQPFDRPLPPVRDPRESTSPIIVLNLASGGASGIYRIAQIMARVFPARRRTARAIAGIMPGMVPLTFSPYPKDTIRYQSPDSLTYLTPPHTEGLGTATGLQPGPDPIQGAAILHGDSDSPDLTLLAVRLPPHLHHLFPVILQSLPKF